MATKKSHFIFWGTGQVGYNQSPKQTLESVAALRDCYRGSAAWLNRYESATQKSPTP